MSLLVASALCVDVPDEQAGYHYDRAGVDVCLVNNGRCACHQAKSQSSDSWKNSPVSIRMPQASTTADLHALVAWLIACGIATVAIESTGVFWIPVYELLEQAGMMPLLVTARHVKTVPCRKTDWNDAQCL